MLRNYIVSALRNIARQKLFSFINIAGLAAGIAVAVFIFLWISDEMSFDSFHEYADSIYRVEEDQFYNNGTYHVQVTPWPSGPVWQSEIPEIASSTRFAYAGNLLFSYDTKRFYERMVWGADSTFFNIFSFDLLRGKPSDVLSEPQSVVISDETAEKYFGDADPVGKTLRINNKDLFTVTGVFRKLPDNSSFNFDILLSFDFMKNTPWYSENWGSNSIQTFVLLKTGTNPTPVNGKLTDVVNEHNNDNTTRFMLTPLKKMHLYSWFGFDENKKGIQNVYVFSLVALFMLIIAAINFMNLTTAKSSTRYREIGMRKITGAHRNNVAIQFMGESLIMSIIATVFALIIVSLLLPTFDNLSGKDFSLHDLFRPVIMSGIAGITIATGILAGLYPSFILSGLKPLNIIRGRDGSPAGKGMFRKMTVIIQFSLTIILITGSVVIYRQLRLLQTQKLGYTKENLLYIPLRGEMKQDYQAIKDELAKSPVVENLTGTVHPPHTIGSNSGGAWWPGKDPDKHTLISTGYVDFGYTETMKITMAEGRTFSPEYGTDAARDTSASFLVNEEMAKIMNVTDPVGTQLRFMGFTGPIVGVMKNYQFHSARENIGPLALVIPPPEYYNYIDIRLKPGDVQENMARLEKDWNRVMPEFPFDYRFVDQEFDQMYRSEERISSLMKYFTLVAIIIACVGLFGLATFEAEQKTREIGIRKVLGARTSSILILFSREFIILLLISAVLAGPAAWYFLGKWLQNYAHRTKLDLFLFVGAGLAALVIALLSISSQAIRAANTNPAKTLKYE